ncbi:MAG: hypothetical protein VCE43_12885 [Myxococcota bacterium]
MLDVEFHCACHATEKSVEEGAYLFFPVARRHRNIVIDGVIGERIHDGFDVRSTPRCAKFPDDPIRVHESSFLRRFGPTLCDSSSPPGVEARGAREDYH